jgi:hypothetical protein
VWRRRRRAAAGRHGARGPRRSQLAAAGTHPLRNPSPPITHPPGEELPLGSVHASLKKEWPRLLTVLAPRHASRAPAIAAALASELGLRTALWSGGGLGAAAGGSGAGGGRPVVPPPLEGVDVLVLDVAADLPLMYWCEPLGASDALAGLGPAGLAPCSLWQGAGAARERGRRGHLAWPTSPPSPGPRILADPAASSSPPAPLPPASVSEIAFIGNSLYEGCGGHNLAEAAVAGCAVLVGEHAGHFGQMADELNQVGRGRGWVGGAGARGRALRSSARPLPDSCARPRRLFCAT